MPTEPVAIGLLGTSPTGHPGPVRASSFPTFQQLVGELESAPAGSYWAGHAACHALMNGLERVVFCGARDLDDEAGLVEAFERLVAEGPVSMVVAPGVLAAAPALVEAFLRWEARERRAGRLRAGDTCLWLDAPDRAEPAEVVALQAAMSPDPERVRVVCPWVPTISPGRRQHERLPATCLAAPLYLAAAPHLRGVHEIGRMAPVAALELRDAGCALLSAGTGRRRLARLDFPDPRPPSREEPAAPTTLEGRIEAALSEAIVELVRGVPSGPGLWKTVERNARSVLDGFVRAGEIADYRVRCDEETNMDLIDGLGVEVVVSVPRRVQQVMIHVSIA